LRPLELRVANSCATRVKKALKVPCFLAKKLFTQPGTKEEKTSRRRQWRNWGATGVPLQGLGLLPHSHSIVYWSPTALRGNPSCQRRGPHPHDKNLQLHRHLPTSISPPQLFLIGRQPCASKCLRASSGELVFHNNVCYRVFPIILVRLF